VTGSEPGPLRVLVVDDSRLVHSRFVGLCEQIAAAEVVGHAFNGAEAIREVKRKQPDLVLMDLIMPDIDGMVALRMLCKGIPGIRVAVVSSMAGSPRIGEEAFKLGAIAVLSKPVAREDLEQLFEGELSRRRGEPGSKVS
jgi:DNA-binding NarL/FixJ family response regulator